MSAPIEAPKSSVLISDLVRLPAKALISALLAKLDDQIGEDDDRIPDEDVAELVANMVGEHDDLRDAVLARLGVDQNDDGSLKDYERKELLADASVLFVTLARAVDAKQSGRASEFDYQFDALANDFQKSGSLYSEAWHRR